MSVVEYVERGEVADADLSLDELAEIANSEHELGEKSLHDALGHFIRSGEALNQAKNAVSHGEWQIWVEQNFRGSLALANIYRRVAQNSAALTAQQVPTLMAAVDYMRRNNSSALIKLTDEQFQERQAEVRRLRAEGKSVAEVAKIFGVAPPTVVRWSASDDRARKRDRGRRERAARSALRRQESDRRAKQVGDAVGEFYSRIRKALDIGQSALDREGDPEARREIGRAMSSLNLAVDAADRAVKNHRSREESEQRSA